MNGHERSAFEPNNGLKGPDIQLISLAAPIRHALKALGRMAGQPQRAMGPAELSRALKLPAAAMSKSFQRLAKAGILSARRGPGGGYRLAAEPARTSLVDIARALDVRGLSRGRCVLEEHPCRGEAACVLHHAAQEAGERLRRELARLTLADLALPAKERRKGT